MALGTDDYILVLIWMIVWIWEIFKGLYDMAFRSNIEGARSSE